VSIPVKFDFKEDLRRYILSQLDETYLNNKLNIYPKTNQLTELQAQNIDNLLWVYINWRNRLILGRKRKVSLSKDIYKNPFYSQYNTNIQKLKRIFESGSNVRPFLSTGVNHLLGNKSDDGLLRDWGLHHIHFIPAYTPKKRTNEILFIMERPNNIYFIDIFEHDDWVKLNSLAIIYRNWPETIEHFKLNGITPDILTEEHFENLRKKDVAYTIGFDGNAYAPTLNSNSRMNTIRNADYLLMFLKNFEQNILNDIENIKQQVESKTNTIIMEFYLELIFYQKEKKVLVKEKTLDICINFESYIPDLNQILTNLNIF